MLPAASQSHPAAREEVRFKTPIDTMYSVPVRASKRDAVDCIVAEEHRFPDRFKFQRAPFSESSTQLRTPHVPRTPYGCWALNEFLAVLSKIPAGAAQRQRQQHCLSQ